MESSGTPDRDVLLERDELLADLARDCVAAAAGQGRFVLLSGEAGVGKTSVIRQFQATVSSRWDGPALVGSCEPLGAPRPLAPLADVAHQLGEDVAHALAGALSGAGVHGLFDRLLAALDRPGRVTVLMVEDVHWADEATLDLLRFLARRIRSARALIVVTYRGDEIGRTHPLAIMLGDIAGVPAVRRRSVDPLSREAVAELAADWPGDVEELFRATGGNPFFVTEALASRSGVPPTVRAAVQARLARLTPRAHAAVERLAVIGPTVSAPRLVKRLVPGGQLGVVEAIEGGLLRAEGELVEFRHELARLAVLDSITGDRRTELHGTVLDALVDGGVADDDLAQVVEHAAQAGDDDAVRRYAPLAGERAAAVASHREAAAHFERALRLADDAPVAERVALLEAARREHYLGGELPEAVTCGRRLLALHQRAADQLAEGDTLRLLSQSLWAVGETKEGRPLAAQALDVLHEVPPGIELARAYANMVELSFLSHDVDSVLHHEPKALDLARELNRPDIAACVEYYGVAARLLATDEGWDELASIRLRVLTNAWLEYVPTLTVVAPCLAAYRHDPGRAIPMLDDAAAFVRDHDMWGFLIFLRGCRAYAQLHGGDWAAAADEVEDMQRNPRWATNPGVAALCTIGLLRARRGEPDVWSTLDAALTWYEEPYPPRLGPLHEARAEAAWLAGDHERVIAEAAHGLIGATSTADPWQSGALACWIVRAGGPPPDVPAAEPYALEIAGDYGAAAAAFERRGLPYEAALARLGGDVDAVRAALATFTTFGATPAADRARTRLLHLGERQGTRRPRMTTRRNPHGLTDRQLDVLALLHKGFTNSEIATELVLSRHTVNHHVSAVLHKLGVTTRTELIRSHDP